MSKNTKVLVDYGAVSIDTGILVYDASAQEVCARDVERLNNILICGKRPADNNLHLLEEKIAGKICFDDKSFLDKFCNQIFIHLSKSIAETEKKIQFSVDDEIFHGISFAAQESCDAIYLEININNKLLLEKVSRILPLVSDELSIFLEKPVVISLLSPAQQETFF